LGLFLFENMAKFRGDSPRLTGQGPASLEGYQGLHLQSAAMLHLVQRLTLRFAAFCNGIQGHWGRY
jgi:hypothetical protein